MFNYTTLKIISGEFLPFTLMVKMKEQYQWTLTAYTGVISLKLYSLKLSQFQKILLKKNVRLKYGRFLQSDFDRGDKKKYFLLI